MDLNNLQKAEQPTQEELDREARAWGFMDWDTFTRYYDEEMERLGTENEK